MKPNWIFSTQTATTTGSVTLCMVTTVNMKMIIDQFQISFFFSVQTTLIACKRKRRMVLMDGDDDAEVSRIQPRWSFNFFFSVPLKENSFPVSSSQLSRGTMMKRRSTLTSRATSSTPRVNSRETQGDLISIVLLKHRCTPHRFMVYWTTIVSTSYTTTYMDTSLIGIMWTLNNPLPFTHKFFDSLFSNPEMHTEWLYPGFKWMWKIEMTKIFLCSL